MQITREEHAFYSNYRSGRPRFTFRAGREERLAAVGSWSLVLFWGGALFSEWAELVGEVLGPGPGSTQVVDSLVPRVGGTSRPCSLRGPRVLVRWPLLMRAESFLAEWC